MAAKAGVGVGARTRSPIMRVTRPVPRNHKPAFSSVPACPFRSSSFPSPPSCTMKSVFYHPSYAKPPEILVAEFGAPPVLRELLGFGPALQRSTFVQPPRPYALHRECKCRVSIIFRIVVHCESDTLGVRVERLPAFSTEIE